MARLIDADDIISVCEILSEKGDNPHYWGQLISIIEDMPTIDAIPVEWLEEHKTEYIDDWGENPVTVEQALKMWQKEQEAQDG